MASNSLKHLQIERLNPLEIDKALAQNSLVFIPLGAIEWHGLHLPIGLDSLTSHGICLKVADKKGGLVMPPFHYGMSGSIWHHPYTILIEEEEVFLGILKTTITRLETIGVKKVVIFTGHFSLRQLNALVTLRKEWLTNQNSMELSIFSINDCPNIEMEADHGAIFETSVLAELHPDLVKLENLLQKDIFPANDVNGNSKGDHRRDPDNVLFGIFGDDPRDYDQPKAEILTQKIIDWLVQSI
ncbi:creatininase family protein [Arenibacter troitsensis]|uniref:Creatinine amidohydrolase n=1 Tax=Arenibacter troitsensis TaxID=188872 RepID=A0A1X7IG40_9FLAO|nr:creatininase family protein [Arenibacter troitsensis]SMG13714.1 creatinine amidohydrolase [Arenibacter troitsensis]